MIIRHQDFAEIVAKFSKSGFYGFDTETTGLRLKDRLFSIILADESEGYYFNFNPYPGVDKELILPRAWIQQMQPIFANPESTLAIHNAKFDMGMMEKEGVKILAGIHCTLALARVEKNNRLPGSYDLASLVAEIGLKKDESVSEYIKKHGLITKVAVPGKKDKEELWHFDRVPFDIITSYGCKDAALHRTLALHQLATFACMDVDRPNAAPPVWGIVQNEKRLTKTCAKIEQIGIKINRQYVSDALAHEQAQAKLAMQQFCDLTGSEFQDSPKVLADAFTASGIELPRTATGRLCTNKQVLDAIEHPLGDLVREIRTRQKLCSTYYSSFLLFADSSDIVRANIRQGGTETGRFSYSDPNLQNLPKEDDEEDLKKPFLVRGSFIPRGEEWCFTMIDYRQQEFRMMLDYAGEKELIASIMTGMDVHDATAQMLGITRKQAKTINFGLLYGMGIDKLAKALKVDVPEATKLRNLYFSRLPKVRKFIQNVITAGRERRHVFNWMGRRCHISDPEFAFILPNHIIQGGGADLIKIAMNRIDDYIMEHGLISRIVCQVHDELLFEMHCTELHHVQPIRTIMEGIYRPQNGMLLTTSVEHSWKSWATRDKVEGFPAI